MKQKIIEQHIINSRKIYLRMDNIEGYVFYSIFDGETEVKYFHHNNNATVKKVAKEYFDDYIKQIKNE